MFMLKVICLFALIALYSSLDNGLARTPPMGWSSWERFRCNVDCVTDPENCISEKLIKETADRMASDGYKEAGYVYVNIDDCWLANERDSQGRLQPDAKRFPSGIKALADYVHNKGLKLGIYADFGTKTCKGYPGTQYYLQLDTETFANWGVDFLKLDGCHSNPHQYTDNNADYPPVHYWLNRTGRPMVYNVAFALDQWVKGMTPNYTRIAEISNMARNFNDMTDSWESVATTVQFYGDDKYNIARLAGPGYFNDPDELIIGDFGLSYEQERVHMGMWAMLAAPLFMSVDLRNIRTESKALLLNKQLLAIDQDPMGIQGRRIQKIGNIDIWTKPIMPKGSLAFAMVNFGVDGIPKRVTAKLSDLGLKNASGYNITEVFDGKAMGIMKPGSSFTASVNPTGIFMAMAVPL